MQMVKLSSYEAFLGQCLSSKGIDIRMREAESLQGRTDREMAGEDQMTPLYVFLSSVFFNRGSQWFTKKAAMHQPV